MTFTHAPLDENSSAPETVEAAPEPVYDPLALYQGDDPQVGALLRERENYRRKGLVTGADKAKWADRISQVDAELAKRDYEVVERAEAPKGSRSRATKS